MNTKKISAVFPSCAGTILMTILLVSGGFTGNGSSEGAAKTAGLEQFFWPIFVPLFYVYCLLSVKLLVIPVYKFCIVNTDRPSVLKLVFAAFVLGGIFGLVANVVLVSAKHIELGFMTTHAALLIVEAIACWLFDNFPKEPSQ